MSVIGSGDGLCVLDHNFLLNLQSMAYQTFEFDSQVALGDATGFDGLF